ncbi:MAG: hypothetical protein UZ11_BCD004001568 [Bacteroidetes bacterium OLB11]|nr:MAG: hypothetical protein UZ11_BCD004001568 [Bacteroidetes bacterium OLB11]
MNLLYQYVVINVFFKQLLILILIHFNINLMDFLNLNFYKIKSPPQKNIKDVCKV